MFLPFSLEEPPTASTVAEVMGTPTAVISLSSGLGFTWSLS
jgi:hypothetical protein